MLSADPCSGDLMITNVSLIRIVSGQVILLYLHKMLRSHIRFKLSPHPQYGYDSASMMHVYMPKFAHKQKVRKNRSERVSYN